MRDPDPDPELRVTRTDGRQTERYQIGALTPGRAWLVVDPTAPCHVIRSRAAAVDARQLLDARIADRLAAGWLPVERRPRPPRRSPARLPADLVFALTSLFDTLERGRDLVRAADSSDQLWAAYERLRQQARRVGVAVPRTRVGRALRERRLGELAEQVGDVATAAWHYRAALAALPQIGVKRRLAHLDRQRAIAADGSTHVRLHSRAHGATARRRRSR